jgi:hypothetical protein
MTRQTTNFHQTMIPSMCYLPTIEDVNIDTSSVVEMDFDVVPYPISPTEGERQERANITKRFGDAWSTPSYHFRPIDDASTLLSDMDSDDDLSIASDEVISTDIFSQTAVLQCSSIRNTDDNETSFVSLDAEEVPDQDSKKNSKDASQGDDFLNRSISVIEWRTRCIEEFVFLPDQHKK